ncbi:cytochrome P450 [Actinokineospora sp. PR83]|uniref:cytochrome P450 n=1 Tax=Actinokineospora sp. PR83 TaxID=2884908 RepID=UPI001F3E6EC8|nr:cytochrome P450 [Actinokineospora sp. PR83]MCG8916429.1 cytochrome P450 [Actinokineospora sp. PR83]
MDESLAVLTKGYAWLPDRLRAENAPVVRTRLMGQRAVCIHGEDAARLFYDERNVHRHGALPEPVKSTLFGHGAVHTLDAADHRRRKSLFTGLLMNREGITDLVDRTTAAWDATVANWVVDRPVTLFEEASRVLTEAVFAWVGLPLPPAEVAPVAADLVTMVDGFATPAPRHFKARAARGRLEKRIADTITGIRDGSVDVAPDSAVRAVASHVDEGGDLLEPRVAAVEVLNIVRPTVAISWFLTFSAHALHRWPETRARLAGGDREYAVAFAHEVRRFYPFAPFLGGLAARDLTFHGQDIPKGAMVLLDVYGHNHDPALFPDPYAFSPERFLNREIGPFELIPQGGGDPRTGHRCPGEDIVITILAALAPRLARLDHAVPEQDLDIPLNRIPTLPRSGFTLARTEHAEWALDTALTPGG